MAHCWVESGAEWRVAPLAGEAFCLSANPEKPVKSRNGKTADGASALLLRHPGSGGEVWVMIAAGAAKSPVRVNGDALLTGIRVLRDRDEILLLGKVRLFFSTESPARIEPFPGAPQPVRCRRCMQPIEPGSRAVKCPACGAWHHQSDDEFPCWTYGETCANCDQPSDLNAGFRWTPEGL